MNNKKARNNNKSLCQKSMKMVTNILKLSSFSIAKMSLGSARPPAATKNLASMKGSIMVASEPLLPQFPLSQRSLEPERSSKPIIEEKGVDWKD
ncbi:hypothetical protein L1049_027819 [Liquidambar formosana]|uniref:Uncharacterized protein n=1 Tax=Liquidambar formosana TaxID=63359 RepID=A0AAP0RJU1_LIQFO